jgi:uncharacterized membrane protein YuzA (DUF378 family)
LPYYWDEAGYYIPAALDFYHRGLLIPQGTLPVGHTPLVMIYLGLVWRVFGFSALVTRAAMILVAAATVASLYALGRRVASTEVAAWSAVLLAVSPLFFAQSSLVHLDLAAGLFTTLALLALLRRRPGMFAFTASLAALSKETAIVLLPVAWLIGWRRKSGHASEAPAKGNNAWPPHPALRGEGVGLWLALAAPLLPLFAWAAYYHHATGYWTGNREYLAYNFYSTLVPARVLWSLLRRLYEIFIGGFNWLLASAAVLGAWGHRQRLNPNREPCSETQEQLQQEFLLLAAALTAVYLVLHSVVGGAILPRYLLPIFPLLMLVAAILIWRLPRRVARFVCLLGMVCFAGAWFINPPYPFPFEDNLAYADFVRLHRQAAKFLEAQPGQPRVLTAWPASDELTRPFLGYLRLPLRVVSVPSFAPGDFSDVAANSFDLLYVYSRKWEPRDNWVVRFPWWRRAQERYFDYQPQVPEEMLAARYRLKLLQRFERRGQWVAIYAKR